MLVRKGGSRHAQSTTGTTEQKPNEASNILISNDFSPIHFFGTLATNPPKSGTSPPTNTETRCYHVFATHSAPASPETFVP